jgi:hypothetical protein
MKKIVLYIGLSIFLLNGCSKSFLETQPESSLLVSNYFSKPEEVRMLTRSMYGRDWFDFLDKACYAIGELMPGNAYTNDGVYKAFLNGTLSSDQALLSYGWNAIYGIITRANISMRNLKQLEVEPGSDMETAKNVTIGECRFFRAYAYFLLVNYWGAVPVVMDNATEYSDIRKNRIVTEDVYEVIIRDLTDAIEKLPETSIQPYLSKLSAKALLSKVYLTRAGMNQGAANDFIQAKTLAKEVIDGASAAGYGLMDNYNDLWLLSNNNNKESLFAWQWSYNTGNDWGIQNTLQAYLAPSSFTGSWDGWSSVVPSIDLINSWEPGDLRRHSTMMEEGSYYPEFWKDEGGYTYDVYTCNYGSPTPTLSNVRKHLAGKDNSSDGRIGEMNTECYTPLIRLADVYLTYTEAVLAKDGATTDAVALGYFNALRDRAGLIEKSSVSYADLFNERRHEFAFEFHCWMDLVRYHRLHPQEVATLLQNQERGFYNVDAAHNKTLVSFKLPSVTDNFFLLPIPATETLIDPLLLEDPIRFDFSNYL